MGTLMLLAATIIYFGIIALLAWDAWDQFKRYRR